MNLPTGIGNSIKRSGVLILGPFHRGPGRSKAWPGAALVVAALFSATFAAAGEEAATIRVSGAEAMLPLLSKLGAEYTRSHPGIKVEVAGGGAGKGVKEALAGSVELGMVSREIEAEEAQRGSFVPVAQDAVFLTASAKNPVAKELAAKGIAKKTLKALFLAGKPVTWGAIAGSADPTPAQAYTREDACGAGETWAKFLGGIQADLQGTPVKGDKSLAEAIRKDPAGLGYNNLQAAYELSQGSVSEGLMIVPVDLNENGKVDPGEDLSTKEKAFQAIAAGTYPTPPARTLYLITKGKYSGASKAFVQWLLKEGQKLAGQTGYIPLDAAAAEAALKKMEE